MKPLLRRINVLSKACTMLNGWIYSEACIYSHECVCCRFVFESPLPTARLVRDVADRAQIGTQRSWKRPWGAGLLVGGVDKGGVKLFYNCPSGNFYDYKAMAIGGRSQVITQYILLGKGSWSSRVSLRGTFVGAPKANMLVYSCIRKSHMKGVLVVEWRFPHSIRVDCARLMLTLIVAQPDAIFHCPLSSLTDVTINCTGNSQGSSSHNAAFFNASSCLPTFQPSLRVLKTFSLMV